MHFLKMHEMTESRRYAGDMLYLVGTVEYRLAGRITTHCAYSWVATNQADGYHSKGIN